MSSSARHDVAADAEAFRALHVPGTPVVLANVWDPPTARLVESAGMRAVATTSAAIAPVNGYEDHGRLPAEIAFGALGRICAAVSLPVTADLEDGYGLPADDLVERIAAAGACGLNLEDTNHGTKSLVDADEQAERIRAIKTAARARGFDVLLNARVDVHLLGQSAAEGLRRAGKYLAAGADCVFPILLSDLAVIRKYVQMGPTAVLWRPGGPKLEELAEAEVARISVGPLLFHLALRRLRLAADAIHRGEDERIWT